jgi:hypothetical protein
MFYAIIRALCKFYGVSDILLNVGDNDIQGSLVLSQLLPLMLRQYINSKQQTCRHKKTTNTQKVSEKTTLDISRTPITTHTQHTVHSIIFWSQTGTRKLN